LSALIAAGRVNGFAPPHTHCMWRLGVYCITAIASLGTIASQ